jgi:hypothetical protein
MIPDTEQRLAKALKELRDLVVRPLSDAPYNPV